MANKISVLVDVATDRASANLKDFAKDFKKSIGEADGAQAKLKAGFGQTGDFIKSHAAGVAAVAGTALIGFAAKAVGEFQTLALAIGKTSDATGVSAEAISRWAEVAGDVGVELGTVEKALLKMEQAAGKTPQAFADLGVEIAKTKDGATDANETFIRTLERLGQIKDPAERAAAGTKLLGKSWAEMAEIVESNDIRGALEGVSDAKVIDEKEVAKARKLRDQMDSLKGVIEDLTLTVGGELVPVLADGAEALNGLVGPAQKLSGVIEWATKMSGAVDKDAKSWRSWAEVVPVLGPLAGDLADAIGGVKDALDDSSESASGAEGAFGNWGSAVVDAADSAADAAATEDRLRTATDRLRTATELLDAKWQALKGTLDAEEAFLALEDTFDGVRQAAVDAYTAADEGAADAGAKAQDAAQSLVGLKQSVLDYGKSVLGLPPEKMTKILADLDAGKVDEVERLLATLARSRDANIRIVARGGAGYGPLNGGPRASGGPTYAGQFHEVLEGGRSELLTENGKTYLMAGADGQVTPLPSASATPAIGGGVTINVNGFVGSEYELGQKLTEVLERWQRGGGS